MRKVVTWVPRDLWCPQGGVLPLPRTSTPDWEIQTQAAAASSSTASSPAKASTAGPDVGEASSGETPAHAVVVTPSQRRAAVVFPLLCLTLALIFTSLCLSPFEDVSDALVLPPLRRNPLSLPLDLPFDLLLNLLVVLQFLMQFPMSLNDSLKHISCTLFNTIISLLLFIHNIEGSTMIESTITRILDSEI